MATRSFISQEVYPVPSNFFLSKLKRIDLLVKGAKPIIRYVRTDNNGSNEMEEGKTYVFKARLFSIFPLGTYTIEVLTINDTHIYSRTSFDIAKVWLHYVDVKSIGENKTMCTHQIDLDAGWKTPIIYWVLKLFYSHNHRNNVKMFGK